MAVAKIIKLKGVKILKKIINKLFNEKKNSVNQDIISKWIRNGKPVPPPHRVKQLVIKSERHKNDFNILIETGTYLGDMVEAQKSVFKKIYSIELGEELFINAVKRFEKDKNVKILRGDSGIVLNDLMPNINGPAIFWLDGHYSEGITAQGMKDCPILEELTAIFAVQKFNHTVLIDDARLFTGSNDYPSVKELREFIKSKIQYFTFTIEDDIIRIVQ